MLDEGKGAAVLMALHPDIAAVLAGDSEGCIVTGDCLAPGFLLDMPDACVDAVVSDIPYGVVNRDSGGLRNLDKGIADEETFAVDEIAGQSWRLAQSVYVFCGTEQVSELRACLVVLGMTTRLCLWEKSNPSPMNGERLWLSSVEACVFGRSPNAYFAERCAAPVWRGPIARNQMHRTQKPLWLMSRLVSASVPAGGIVLDFCAGSGTTCVAAKKLGRRWIGIEIDEKYAKIARHRVAGTPRPLFPEPTKGKEPVSSLF